ncbi:SMAD/FHA domain-containing protein [Gloeopeniophorella convolvens]|nr:SMAD/FHA domain-containing protein [Gloeopeniophorella convolvens]
MPQRSPSPGSSRRYRRYEDEDNYRGRRSDTDGHGRSVDRDTRDDGRERRAPEEGRRRDYNDDRDDRRRKVDVDDLRRRDTDRRHRNGDDYDRDRRRRDNDRELYPARPRNDDRDRSQRDDYQGRNNRDDRDRRDRDRERGGSSRRSASPPRRSGSPSGSAPPEDKAKPNFAPSGLLAAATNTVKNSDGTSTLLKYNEPPEARKPVVGWRLYVFKGDEQVDLLHIHRQSAYLIGRDRMVADITLEHPSCSKQHAAIQYRSVQQKDEFGNARAVVKPFVIDLESTNGTHVNGETIPTSRYYELKASDVLKFGTSNREYVLLHDEAA